MASSIASVSDTWRVGVLFSRTGLTAVTETEHFLGTALAIQQINQAGGILGREIEVVAYDPESDPETYRRLADRLLTDDGISVIFGCSSSAERKAVLPAIERRNGLLWYPSLYEGFEYSPNVIYTGASPIRPVFRSPNISSATTGVGCFWSDPITSIHANQTASCVIWWNPMAARSSTRSMLPWPRRNHACATS